MAKRAWGLAGFFAEIAAVLVDGAGMCRPAPGLGLAEIALDFRPVFRPKRASALPLEMASRKMRQKTTVGTKPSKMFMWIKLAWLMELSERDMARGMAPMVWIMTAPKPGRSRW